MEALELSALAVTAAVAQLGRRVLRRINRRGLVGWGVTLCLVLVVAAALVELAELV